jgi:hypothetical protein
MVTPPCCGGRTTEFRNQRAEPTVGPLKPKGRKQTYTDKGTRDRNSSDHRTWNTKLMLPEVVHDLIATGETTVDRTTAVLRCGKQIKKKNIPHYRFFPDSVFPKIEANAKYFLRRYLRKSEGTGNWKRKQVGRVQWTSSFGPVARRYDMLHPDSI